MNVAHMGESRVVYKVLLDQPEGRRLFGIPRLDGKMDLQEVGRGCGD